MNDIDRDGPRELSMLVHSAALTRQDLLVQRPTVKQSPPAENVRIDLNKPVSWRHGVKRTPLLRL